MAKKAPVKGEDQKAEELRVIELRRAGLTWSKIAQDMGYADHTGAYRAHQKAMQNNRLQKPDEMLEQEIDRLDRLQVAAWPKALAGDTAAIGTIIKIIEQRVKLLGLSDGERKESAPDIWDQLAAEILK